MQNIDKKNNSMESYIQNFTQTRSKIKTHQISKRKIPETYIKINDQIRKKLIVNVI